MVGSVSGDVGCWMGRRWYEMQCRKENEIKETNERKKEIQGTEKKRKEKKQKEKNRKEKKRKVPGHAPRRLVQYNTIAK